jgi:hypothetical protein
VLDPLAQDEGEPVELEVALAAGAGQEELAEARHDGAGGGAEQLGRGGHLAPAEDLDALFRGDHGDGGAGGGLFLVGVGDEGEADGVGSLGGQREGDLLAQERVRDLDQDAGAVARVGLRAGGPAVLEVPECGQCLVDDLVARLAGEGGDEGDTAGVPFGTRVIEALRRGYRAPECTWGLGGR